MPLSRWALITFVALDFLLTIARIVEVTAGHVPTGELSAAFSASVTATLAAAAWALHQHDGR